MWQLIETAPKDGSEIVVVGLDWGKGPLHVQIAHWEDGDWYGRGDDEIRVRLIYLTHWAHLPELTAP